MSRDPGTDLRRIAEAALQSVDPGLLVARCLQLSGSVLSVRAPGVRHDVDLASFSRVFVLGLGKAAGAMAHAVEQILGDRIDRGLVVVKPGREAPLRLVRQVTGGHPVPDESSARAALELGALADEADPRTLVITLISGGGSALAAAPEGAAGIELSLADIQETTRLLLACGAAIEEMNCIRKHLLLLSGGKLARRIAPATCLGLVLSDVVGDDLQTIASGPTCPDSTTFDQALSIIGSRGIDSRLPAAVLRVLQDGAKGRIPETPKPGAAELERASTFLVGSNLLALGAAADRAALLGYHPLVLTSRLTGEAREAARVLAAVAREVAATGSPCPRPACLLCGGETTVTVKGAGVGGRNQEMAAAFLQEIDRDPSLLSGAWFLSFSTDGEDGPTDAAGGFADASRAAAARRAGLSIGDALRENDSHTLLDRLGGLFITGPTSTNVCDIQVILVT